MTESIHTARYQRFRTLLIEARKSRGMSQELLAEQVNRVQTFVSKYERGERRLDVIEFLEVTAALGIDPIRIIRQLQTVDSE